MPADLKGRHARRVLEAWEGEAQGWFPSRRTQVLQCSNVPLMPGPSAVVLQGPAVSPVCGRKPQS